MSGQRSISEISDSLSGLISVWPTAKKPVSTVPTADAPLKASDGPSSGGRLHVPSRWIPQSEPLVIVEEAEPSERPLSDVNLRDEERSDPRSRFDDIKCR